VQQTGSGAALSSTCNSLFQLMLRHQSSLHAHPVKWYIDTTCRHGKLCTTNFQEP